MFLVDEFFSILPQTLLGATWAVELRVLALKVQDHPYYFEKTKHVMTGRFG